MLLRPVETYIRGFRKRLAARWGLADLSRVNGGYDLAPQGMIVYDMQYIRNMSAVMDLQYLLKCSRIDLYL